MPVPDAPAATTAAASEQGAVEEGAMERGAVKQGAPVAINPHKSPSKKLTDEQLRERLAEVRRKLAALDSHCTATDGSSPNEAGELSTTEKWGKTIYGDVRGMRYGVVEYPTKKDQDRWDHFSELSDESPQAQRADVGTPAAMEFQFQQPIMHAFGVFDGHGCSAAAADVCKAYLLQEPIAPQLNERNCSLCVDEVLNDPAPGTTQHMQLAPLKKGLVPSDAAIAESFRSVDAQVAREHRDVRCGTTATSVYIGYEPASDTWDVKCGWAGDSRAVLIEPDAKTFANLAIDHRIENDAERERIDVAAKTDLLPNGTPRSYITRRQNSRGEYGPKAVFSGTTGISHLMTRSIGDPHGAPALIPDAEIISKQGVANGSWVVLASDGLWDVFDEAGVAKVVRSTRHPARAARKLTLDSVARRRQYGMTADDVTVIVIELTAPVIQPPESRTSPSKVADIDH
mmetsp:Transcript_83609/g.235928  ORF Transcript_83609/g.235928 Transcript_83609/m.235928 type:complete len:457 (-) Transcript_83609:316-1686(-)